MVDRKAAISAIKDLARALIGISGFDPQPMPGPQLDDEAINETRKALGGELETIPSVRLRWYPPDIERAQHMAQNGDMTMIGQLVESMKNDGVIRGLGDARTSVVNFPKRFYGDRSIVDVLRDKTGSDRDVYNEMIPSSEARLMVWDGLTAGASIGEMVPVQGRNFPVLIRRYPQNLFFLWNRHQWYYRSIAGLIPINPGQVSSSGNMWILHIPGGRLYPWNSGLWNPLGRSYINKTQSIFMRQSYATKHSSPGRFATAPLGATEEERSGLLQRLISWSLNTAAVLPIGWDVKIVESRGQGWQIYTEDIKAHNEEIATCLCGSSVMLQGTAGFSNMDVFRVVQLDLIRATAEAWDHTVNTQILPAYIGQTWGVEALKNAVTVETEVEAPKERSGEAATYVQLANAIKGLVEAVASAQVSAGIKQPIVVDIEELMARYGVPTILGPSHEVRPHSHIELAPTDISKVVTVDEAREGQGLDKMGDKRGDMTISELEKGGDSGNEGGSGPTSLGGNSMSAIARGGSLMSGQWHEELHPRGPDGHFIKGGGASSKNAEAASKKTTGKKASTESHNKAAEAHKFAANEHRKSAARRAAVLSKKGLSKGERAKHRAELEKAEAKAEEHRKAASKHRAEAKELAKKSGLEGKNYDDIKDEPEAKFDDWEIPEAPARKTQTSSELKMDVALTKRGRQALDSVLAKGFDAVVQRKKVAVAQVEEMPGKYSRADGLFIPHNENYKSPSIFIRSLPYLKKTLKFENKEFTGGIGEGCFRVGSAIARGGGYEDEILFRESTMLHELSHHLHLILHEQNLPAYRRVAKLFGDRFEIVNTGNPDSPHKAMPRNDGVWCASQYGQSNVFEYFAETMSAYHYAPEVLKNKDPEAFETFDKIMKWAVSK